jgi:hypothetical protein
VTNSPPTTVLRAATELVSHNGNCGGRDDIRRRNFKLSVPVAPRKGAFVHLGFPGYFRIELTTAKALGVLALLLPGVPTKVKEFAYFGFGITLASAPSRISRLAIRRSS